MNTNWFKLFSGIARLFWSRPSWSSTWGKRGTGNGPRYRLGLLQMAVVESLESRLYLSITGSSTTFVSTKGGATSIDGTGTVYVGSSVDVTASRVREQNLTINGGVLQIAPSGNIDDFTHVSVVSGLDLTDGQGHLSGTLDLTNNALIIQCNSASDATSLYASVQQDVVFGQTHNAGIISSTDAASGYGLAVFLNTNGGTRLGTFDSDAAIRPNANSVIVMSELLGDANLDGTVDLTDLATVLNDMGQQTANWTSGNFDGANTIDLTDLKRCVEQLWDGFRHAIRAGTHFSTFFLCCRFSKCGWQCQCVQRKHNVGDGTTSLGAIVSDGAGFHVFGSHPYGASGEYNIQTQVTGANSDTSQINSTANIGYGVISPQTVGNVDGIGSVYIPVGASIAATRVREQSLSVLGSLSLTDSPLGAQDPSHVSVISNLALPTDGNNNFLGQLDIGNNAARSFRRRLVPGRAPLLW